jgi:catechol 2,3-dioxygenase-like lactoylglutathione lyase family enzyme
MQMNGIAHIVINVTDFAACRSFYAKLFDFLEMQLVYDRPDMLYGVGSRTGILVRTAGPEFATERFSQQRAGLNHFCFRARSAEDVDALHRFLLSIGARIIHAPETGPWAKGYYSVLFEDPEGIRIEANYVPGKGNLDAAVELPLRDQGLT